MLEISWMLSLVRAVVGAKNPRFCLNGLGILYWCTSFVLKAHSHYCVFRVRLRQTVALLRRDRKIPISALTQSTAESADCCGECEWALSAPWMRYVWVVGRYMWEPLSVFVTERKSQEGCVCVLVIVKIVVCSLDLKRERYLQRGGERDKYVRVWLFSWHRLVVEEDIFSVSRWISYFFEIWPFTTMKICPKSLTFCQSRL